MFWFHDDNSYHPKTNLKNKRYFTFAIRYRTVYVRSDDKLIIADVRIKNELRFKWLERVRKRYHATSKTGDDFYTTCLYSTINAELRRFYCWLERSTTRYALEYLKPNVVDYVGCSIRRYADHQTSTPMLGTKVNHVSAYEHICTFNELMQAIQGWLNITT